MRQITLYRVSVLQEVMVLGENAEVAALIGQDALLVSDIPLQVTAVEVSRIEDVPLGLRHRTPERTCAAEAVIAPQDEDKPCRTWIEILDEWKKQASAKAEAERLQLPLPRIG